MNNVMSTRTRLASPLLMVLVLGLVPAMLCGQTAPSAGGAVSPAPLETTLIIRETPENLLKIEQIIKSLDVPPRQVLIEAHIFDVALDDQNSTGIDWSALMTQLGRTEPLWQFDQTLAPAGGNGVLRFGTLSNEHFTLLLRGLKKNNRARSLSNPKVTAMNGQNALIEVGQKVPYVTTNTTVSNGTTITNREVKFEPVPINLSVTPTIYDDGTIRLRVTPTITALRSFVEGVPWTETRTANTDVIIRTGETLILGGLITESKSEDTNTMPLLGRLPVFKKVFNAVARTNKRSELVVFITPNIIAGERGKDLSSYAPQNLSMR
ncbi:MAG: Type IV pilus biogenesis protein PilQ [Candidatus Ozemobacter sibiricus]|jgi:type II secretory pathway component GspD/PulD (secretin)|uniref:Type IV pilus biogenesis protein PilQ n=1 Tax=Candidatus Ozemobacter sibiricus TaxID=2268124 RepID=A0A367ZQQ3_9BACT|nr:MAG: Type IV pilus biogenesis protein PilQ [Candidatus Ozemobacter sibiricus]